MNYVILIIAGVCGMVVGSYLGKRQRVRKAKNKIINNPQATNEQNTENKEKIN
jgi:uncharacterized membrane protein